MMEPVWMLTSGLVLHGTPDNPSVAGLHAASVRDSGVLVLAGGAAHGWFVRPVFTEVPSISTARRRPARPTQFRAIEARPVVCREQSDLVAPQEVAAQAGRLLSRDLP